MRTVAVLMAKMLPRAVMCPLSTSMLKSLTLNHHRLTNKLEIRLIRAVCRFPEIYNLTLASYKNRKQKDMAWKKISEHVGLSDAMCRRRWTGLRDTYTRECKKKMRAMRSGADVAGSWVKWKYDEEFAFLRPFIKGFVKTESQGHLETRAAEGSRGTPGPVLLEGDGGSSGCAVKPAEIEVTVADESERESTVDRCAVNCVRTPWGPTVRQSSAELFVRSIVPHLERLPLEKLLKVQIQILQIVQDATGKEVL